MKLGQCSKSTKQLIDLPIDIILEILSKVATKSLFGLHCASKTLRRLVRLYNICPRALQLMKYYKILLCYYQCRSYSTLDQLERIQGHCGWFFNNKATLMSWSCIQIFPRSNGITNDKMTSSYQKKYEILKI